MNEEQKNSLWTIKRLMLMLIITCGIIFGYADSASAATISGRVYQDINNNSMNNIGDGIDIGVDGITVKLTKISDGSSQTTLTTTCTMPCDTGLCLVPSPLGNRDQA